LVDINYKLYINYSFIKHFYLKKGENTEESVKMNIFDYCNKYLKQIPRELHDKLERPLPNQTRSNFIN
jgi:hypothetical protein